MAGDRWSDACDAKFNALAAGSETVTRAQLLQVAATTERLQLGIVLAGVR